MAAYKQKSAICKQAIENFHVERESTLLNFNYNGFILLQTTDIIKSHNPIPTDLSGNIIITDYNIAKKFQLNIKNLSLLLMKIFRNQIQILYPQISIQQMW